MTKPIIEYWANGNKRIEQYKVNGQLHRDPLIGPAEIIYYQNGEIELELYFLNDKQHNPYGPAVIFHCLSLEGWYFNDKPYTIEVNEYLNVNRLNYKTMTKIDFNIMWTIIL